MAPLFDKADSVLLKAWIVKRLENTSVVPSAKRRLL
jgi:hypothetical protein